MDGNIKMTTTYTIANKTSEVYSVTVRGLNKSEEVKQTLLIELEKYGSLFDKKKDDQSPTNPQRLNESIANFTIHYVLKHVSYAEFKTTLMHWNFESSMELIAYLEFLKPRMKQWRKWCKSNYFWWDAYTRRITYTQGVKTVEEKQEPQYMF